MSLKMMPFLGKSGTSRMRLLRSMRRLRRGFQRPRTLRKWEIQEKAGQARGSLHKFGEKFTVFFPVGLHKDADLLEGLLFDLADAFPGHTQGNPCLFQGPGFVLIEP